MEGMPKDEFTAEELKRAWDEFLKKLHTDHKIPAYNALQSGKIELKDKFLIEFEFSSSSSSNEFDLQRENLMRFLREKFNNYGIEFKVKVVENLTQNFIKSKAEIFKELAEKNPILMKMKEEFGLDINSND